VDVKALMSKFHWCSSIFFKDSTYSYSNSPMVHSCKIQELTQFDFILYHLLCFLYFKLTISLIVKSNLYSWFLLRWLTKFTSSSQDLFVKCLFSWVLSIYFLYPAWTV
jgi:hypothetical protein